MNYKCKENYEQQQKSILECIRRIIGAAADEILDISLLIPWWAAFVGAGESRLNLVEPTQALDLVYDFLCCCNEEFGVYSSLFSGFLTPRSRYQALEFNTFDFDFELYDFE